MIGLAQHGQAMGDGDYRDTLLLKESQGLEDPIQGLDVDPAVGLVHQHQPGLHGENAGQFDPFAFATGKGLVDRPVGVSVGLQADLIQHLPQAFIALVLGRGEDEIAASRPSKRAGSCQARVMPRRAFREPASS